MRVKLVLFAALLSVATPLAADITGTWSGTFSATLPCVYSNQTLQIAGPITLFIDQPPFQASPRFAATGTGFAAFPDNVACRAKSAASIPLNINGGINGDIISDAVLLLPAFGAFRPTGSVQGETLTLGGTGDFGGMFSLNATRIDKESPPKFRTSERYSGTYTFDGDFSYRCPNVGRVTSSGNIELIVGDVGRGISGAIRINSFTSVGPARDGICPADNRMDPANLSILGTLSPGTDNTVTGFIGLGFDFLPFTGSFDLRSFRISATTPGNGKFEFSLTNAVPIRVPDIRSFESFPPTAANGEPVRLAWRTQFTDKVVIDNGVGDQPPVGSVVVRPDRTTVYKLSAINTGGSTDRTITVTVLNDPNVQLGQPPRGFTQRPNEGGGTDTFALVNRGFGDTTVTLTSNETFFTFAPASFALARGATQTITITGKAMPAGPYRGTINIAAASGRAVPFVFVNMLVTAGQAAGSVRPRATSSRVEVSSSAGQNATGSVSFTNLGTATLQGVAVASERFIDPQDGLITIPPGQTVPVSFTINAGRRPLDTPLGAATGSLALRFLGGSGTGPAMLQSGGSGSSTVNVTLVHVAKPVTGPGIPPPLAPGEEAFFVSGLSNRPNAVGDLLFGNKQSTPLSSFALFVSGTGVSASAGLSQILANSSIELPGLLKNVLGASVPTGTAQLRGADAPKAVLAAILSNTSSPAGTYSTALPVLKAQASTAARGEIILTGLEKSTTARTDVFVQETSGVGGTFAVDFLDASGAVISSRPSENIAAFGFSELTDSAPSNTAAARITNGSSSEGKLSAYAMVTNPVTSDGWLVMDPSAGSSGDSTFIVPVFPARDGASTVLYTTNRTTTPVMVTLDVPGGTGGEPQPAGRRRRSVGRGDAVTPLRQQTQESLTISPLQTVTRTVNAPAGFVRVTGPAGAISTAARSVVADGASAYGSGLPAVPVSAALAAGGNRRFIGVDDASASSRTNAVPATFLTNVQLVETANASAVVRLTMQFIVSSGSLVTSTARISKDYTVPAGESVTISDLGQALLGSSRASVGDLRNVTLDIDVVSGSGKVVPFLQSIDNGSGDTIVRVE